MTSYASARDFVDYFRWCEAYPSLLGSLSQALLVFLSCFNNECSNVCSNVCSIVCSIVQHCRLKQLSCHHPLLSLSWDECPFFWFPCDFVRLTVWRLGHEVKNWTIGSIQEQFALARFRSWGACYTVSGQAFTIVHLCISWPFHSRVPSQDQRTDLNTERWKKCLGWKG